MSEKEFATLEELVKMLSKFTPAQIELFRLAAQPIIEQMLIQDDSSKSE